MAVTSVESANQVERWRKNYFKEYVREIIFSDHMSTKMNAPVQLIEELTKKAGDAITVPMIRRLTGAGVTADNTLEGNEEQLLNYGHKITVDQLRNAVAIGDMEHRKTEMDLLNAGKEMLKYWSMANLRDEIIAAMLSGNVDGATAYASCSEAEKDAWAAANSDRILYGPDVANYTGDNSADLAKIVASTDTLSAAIVSLAKRKAKIADPHIRPIRTKGGEEWFVMYTNSLAFRDFKTDSTILQSHREGWTRGKDNPLFRDGDILWDGVIVREVPEISVLSGVGDSSGDIAPCFLCGAQAVGVAWGKRPTPIFDERDYKNIKGVGVCEVRGVNRLHFNSVMNGQVTVFVPGVADA